MLYLCCSTHIFAVVSAEPVAAKKALQLLLCQIVAVIVFRFDAHFVGVRFFACARSTVGKLELISLALDAAGAGRSVAACCCAGGPAWCRPGFLQKEESAGEFFFFFLATGWEKRQLTLGSAAGAGAGALASTVGVCYLREWQAGGERCSLVRRQEGS